MTLTDDPDFASPVARSVGLDPGSVGEGGHCHLEAELFLSFNFFNRVRPIVRSF